MAQNSPFFVSLLVYCVLVHLLTLKRTSKAGDDNGLKKTTQSFLALDIVVFIILHLFEKECISLTKIYLRFET